MRKRTRRRKGQSTLPPEVRAKKRIQRRFSSDIRTLFTNAGFTYVPTRDDSFQFQGRTGEIDGIFLIDNVVVIMEETTLAGDHISAHLRKKVEFFQHFAGADTDVVPFLAARFPRMQKYLNDHGYIDSRQYVVRYVYCSRYDVDEAYRRRYSSTCSLLPYPSLQYFLKLSRTIHRSARYELFKFLGIELDDIVGPTRREFHSYRALLLPEVPSGFPNGHKLVSFLIDPQTLIERAYVLRGDSWRDQDALYQRLLVKGKIGSMREYLISERRVFVNNIIVTLPDTARFTGATAVREGHDADSVADGELILPRAFNTIGIIDGQHRVFAYHEGNDKYENKIALLRKRQHLLVTGIIYPKAIAPQRAREFEAKLFLEINDKQKRVRGDLKQSIERIVNPYSAIAVAKSVIERMADVGPLKGMLEVHFFDSGKIKTASIVSYGLRHIVDIHGDESLFRLWHGRGKSKVRAHSGKTELMEYVGFAATHLNLLIGGFKAAVNESLWTTDRRTSRALSTTTINGLIFCMRQLIVNDKVGNDFEYYRSRFRHMEIDFRPGLFEYKSSHWRELGKLLFKQCFAD